MNTINIFIKNSGSVAELKKDFALYAGSYRNSVIDVYIPTEILETNEYGTFVDAVKIGGILTAPNGEEITTDPYYMSFKEKVMLPDLINASVQVEYAVFERRLPKAFTLYAGQQTLVVNIVSVEIPEPIEQEQEQEQEEPVISQIITSQTCKLLVQPSAYLGDENLERPSAWEELVGRVTTNEENISELQSDVGELDGQINGENGIDARLTIAENDIVDIKGDIVDIKGDIRDINTLDGEQNTRLGTLDNKVAALEDIVGSGEYYIGTYTASYDPETQFVALSDALDDFVHQKTATVEQPLGRDPQGGDVIIYVQSVTGGEDRNYKFIYAGAQDKWTYYEIPATEKADNSTYGIVKGSYGSGSNTEVEISGGNFQNIWVKQDSSNTKKNLYGYLNSLDDQINNSSNGVKQRLSTVEQNVSQNTLDISALDTSVGNILNGTTVVPKAEQAEKDGLNRIITDTYMTQASGATKQELIDYALPRTFNDVSFVGADHLYTDTIPETISPLYSTLVSQIGDSELFYVEKTIQNAEFELSNKNSYTTTLYLTASVDCSVAYRVITEIYKNEQWVLLNAELTDPVDMVAGIIKKVNFGSPFNSLDEVINVENGDKIRQTFEVQTSTSTATTFSIYSNETYPSTFYLNTTAQTIVVAQGYLGELPYYNLTGAMVSDDLVFDLPADVQLHENVVGVFNLYYNQTIPDNTAIYLTHNNEHIRIITPYNYSNSSDTIKQDLEQVYHDNYGYLLTGLFKTIGGDLCLIANIDDLTSVKEELINSSVFKALAPSSATLTEAEFTTLQNNNCVLTTDINISATTLLAGTILTKPFEYSGTLRGLYINNSKIGTYLVTISTRTIGAGAQDIVLNNLAQINGKAIPSYPSNTGTFVFEMVDGTLTWSQKIEYGFQKFAVADWNNLTAQERVALIQHGVIIDGTLATMKNPILLPPTSSTSAGLWGVAIHGDTYEPQKINIYSISTTYGTISVNTNYGLKARIDVADFGNDATIIKDSQNRVTIKFGNNEKAKFGSLDALFACRVTPDTNNTYDLGRSGVYWKDLYLAGLLTDGTNSIAIADIASKNFVNSSIATNTANFIGTFANVSALEAYSGTITNNDYAFVTNSVVEDNGGDWATFADLDLYDKTLLTNFDYAWVINSSNFDLYRFDIETQTWGLRVQNTAKSAVTLNTAYNRYKAVVSGSTVTWTFEYTLNNSSFTAQQWQAINSGINPTLVAQISTNAGNITSLQTNKENISNKVTSLDANSTDTEYPSAKCVYDLVGNLNTILTTLNSGNGV